MEMARLEREFREMMEICLWGNATDLSLLTSLTHEQIQELQSVERGSHFILKDDLASVWNSVKELKGGRIDFVLDNVSRFLLFHPSQYRNESTDEMENSLDSSYSPIWFWRIGS